MSLDQINKDLEQQETWKKEKEARDALADFGNNEYSDKALLEDPKFGQNAVNAIKDDIGEKAKQVNDPETKAKIEGLIKEMDSYSKLGKLTQDQAKELSEIYKQVVSVQATEHKEDMGKTEEAQKSSKEKKDGDSKKLLDATEKLRDFMKNNQEAADKKFQEARAKTQEAKNAGNLDKAQAGNEAEKSIANFPTPTKENPS